MGTVCSTPQPSFDLRLSLGIPLLVYGHSTAFYLFMMKLFPKGDFGTCDDKN